MVVQYDTPKGMHLTVVYFSDYPISSNFDGQPMIEDRSKLEGRFTWRGSEYIAMIG